MWDSSPRVTYHQHVALTISANLVRPLHIYMIAFHPIKFLKNKDFTSMFEQCSHNQGNWGLGKAAGTTNIKKVTINQNVEYAGSNMGWKFNFLEILGMFFWQHYLWLYLKILCTVLICLHFLYAGDNVNLSRNPLIPTVVGTLTTVPNSAIYSQMQLLFTNKAQWVLGYYVLINC